MYVTGTIHVHIQLPSGNMSLDDSSSLTVVSIDRIRGRTLVLLEIECLGKFGAVVPGHILVLCSLLMPCSPYFVFFHTRILIM